MASTDPLYAPVRQKEEVGEVGLRCEDIFSAQGGVTVKVRRLRLGAMPPGSHPPRRPLRRIRVAPVTIRSVALPLLESQLKVQSVCYRRALSTDP